MAEDVRQVLARIVREYGTSITEDARRCEGLLRDLCPDSRREVFILSSAIRERVPAELLGSQSTVPHPVICARLAERLETNLGLTHDFAAWAVEIWYSCLGIGGATATSAGRSSLNRDSEAVVSRSLPQNREQSGRPVLDTVTVSSHGHGHYSTIGSALAAVGSGTRILVRQGLYRESLIIDKHVEIIGDGDLSDIEVSSSSGPCLMMKADHAVVRNVLLCGTRGDETEGVAAVVIGRGKLIMEDCDITCSSSHCILIRGKDADPVVRRCSIHDGAASGVRVYGNGLGTFEECDIWANARAGVEVSGGGNPTIKNCRIHDNNTCGVRVHGNGLGTLESCDIWANTLFGVGISTGGNPTIKDCKIIGGKKAGVHIGNRGCGTVEQCDIRGSEGSGVVLVESGDPIIRGCKICDSKKNGVWVDDGGRGTIDRCDIWGNACAGVAISGRGDPEIRDCRIHDGWNAGVYVNGNGRGTIDRCDIWGNASPGIAVTTGGNPTVRHCKIHDGKDVGVYVCAGGRGTFEACETWGNMVYGVEAERDCKPICVGCLHRDGGLQPC